MSEGLASNLRRRLHELRAAEREQALFYRALAAEAEERGHSSLAERIEGLHADEQHHLSRITARLLELGDELEALPVSSPADAVLSRWPAAAEVRERAEVGRYEEFIGRALDDHTRAVVEGILRTERLHVETLRGKWTPA